MNVSASSGASAAWMLQQLFKGGAETSVTTTASGAGRQKMPGGGGHDCKTGGASAPQMSGGTMSAMVGMQMEAPSSSKFGASDIASDLIGGLDTGGDGEVSAEEITAALSAAGLSTDGVADAVASIDADGDGKLDADELTQAVSSDMEAHRPKGPPPGGRPLGGPPPGGPPSADEVASSILSAFDTDEDDGLSLPEIAAGLGKGEDASDELGALFSSLDTDGDGVLGSAELSSAIQQRMDAAYRAYAQTAALSGELA